MKPATGSSPRSVVTGALRVAATCLVWALTCPSPATAETASPPASHSAHQHAGDSASALEHSRSEHAYKLPNLTLVRHDGRRIAFPAEIDDGRPVVVNFVFTTCTTICPMLSQVFAQLQTRLEPDAAKVHLVSISLDPENDTPEHLRAFAEKFHAKPGWDLYTGTAKASVDVQKGFDVYRGDKMNHRPVVLIRKTPRGPWVRLDGFTTAAAIKTELDRP